MRPPFNPALCLVLDPVMCGGHREGLEQARAAINGGITTLQLRDKRMNKGPLLRLADELLPLAHSNRITFLINDHIDVAMACGADGVHIGQNDIPVGVARRLLGEDALIGLSIDSTEEQEQLEGAKQFGGAIDYVGVGPVFSTRSKADAAPAIGLKGVELIAAQLPHLPKMAIGGIDASNAAAVMRAGANGIAVLSALCSLPLKEVEKVAGQMRRLVDENGAREEVVGKEVVGDRIYLHINGRRASYWRDLPLRNSDGTFNAVVEIPQQSVAISEISMEYDLTPLKCVTHANGAPRALRSASLVNYGALPQTYSDPKEHYQGFHGDGDPLDVLEIGSRAYECGDVVRVKVLGCMALIDKGELDWKIIALNVRDPHAGEVHTLEDARRHFPVLQQIHHYCLTYRAPHSNTFLHPDEEFLNAEFTMGIIQRAHTYWVREMGGGVK